MSELEKEELESRIKGMTSEEQEIVVSCIDAEILLMEIGNRFLDLQQKIDTAKQMLS